MPLVAQNLQTLSVPFAQKKIKKKKVEKKKSEVWTSPKKSQTLAPPPLAFRQRDSSAKKKTLEIGQLEHLIQTCKKESSARDSGRDGALEQLILF